jgi:ClpP class serine protease
MDPHAVLGPVDPQIADPARGSIPAVSILKAVERKGVDKVEDETLIKADIATKAVKQIEDLIAKLRLTNLARRRRKGWLKP